MKKPNLLWRTNPKWVEYEENGRAYPKKDASEEIIESYKKYIKQIVEDTQ